MNPKIRKKSVRNFAARFSLNLKNGIHSEWIPIH